jgi:hypothetical protein
MSTLPNLSQQQVNATPHYATITGVVERLVRPRGRELTLRSILYKFIILLQLRALRESSGSIKIDRE